MILGMSTFTFVHVVLSLVGLVSGVIAVVGLLTSRRLEGWTAIFLATTVATSATGFGFPFDRFLPSHWLGVISLVVLLVAIVARYIFGLAGAWRWIYASGAVLAFYFNTFVAVTQGFQKIPFLKAMAPTQSEPPFLIVQIAVLVIFVVLAIASAIKFRPRR